MHPTSHKLDLRLDFVAIVAFLCGLLEAVSFSALGQIFVAELAMIPLGVLVLVLRGDAGLFSNKAFWLFFAAGIITLLGYVISDFIVGTLPSQYLRGWGRVIFLISNMIWLSLFAMHGRKNIWWFVLGMGLGGVAYYFAQGMPLYQWKLGYGEKVAFIVVSLACLLPRKTNALALIAFGFLNIGLDYRSMGAAFVAAGGIVLSKTKLSEYQGARKKQLVPIFIAGVVSLLLVQLALSLTEDQFSDRREESGIGRWAGIVVSLRAIADSPIIGYGSWTVNEKYAQMVVDEARKARAKGKEKRIQHAKVFRSHSQILQPWVEGGVLGAMFFILYGVMLIKALWFSTLVKGFDAILSLEMYIFILGLWQYIASPFGGDQRVLIGMAVALILASKGRGTTRPEEPVEVADEPVYGDGRILRRRKDSTQSRAERQISA